MTTLSLPFLAVYAAPLSANILGQNQACLIVTSLFWNFFGSFRHNLMDNSYAKMFQYFLSLLLILKFK
jgi:hypothetical protein